MSGASIDLGGPRVSGTIARINAQRDMPRRIQA
jgi:hypothetical protein